MSKIIRDTGIVGGQPTLKGRRLTVHNIVSGIYDEGLNPFTQDRKISLEDAKEAVSYCMNLDCKKTSGEYCEHCILSNPTIDNELNKGWEIAKEVYNRNWK